MLAYIKLDGHGPYQGVVSQSGDSNIIVNIPQAHIGRYALERLAEVHYRHLGDLVGASVLTRSYAEVDGKPSMYRIRIEATLY